MLPRKLVPLAAASASSLLILLVVAVSGTWFYQRADRGLHEEVRDRLQQMASAGAHLVDPALHQTFHSPAQETTAAYARALENLNRLRLAHRDMKFIYTCILLRDSVFFILDPTPPGDQDGDGVDEKSHVMQPYPEASPACRKALADRAAAVDAEPYTDQWGTFISAYHPFFEGDRFVGVVGVDMELNRHLERISAVHTAAVWGLLLALALSGLVGLGVYYIVKLLLIAMHQRQKALAKAEQATLAKGEFLAVMSHEIRTPMNGIIGMLNMLLDERLEPRQEESARTARDSAESLMAILNDILDFSKIEAGKIVLESIPFDLAAVCADVERLLGFQARGKGLALSFPIDGGMRTRVTGDPGRLRQILINLAGNAVKFTRQGEVTVRIRWREETASGGVLEVRVEDTGPGIPEEKLGLLFRKFSQADASTTRQFGGTGLGLAICKRLVEMMGGEIGAASRPGEGSVFRFTLPLPWDGDAARAVAGGPAGREWDPLRLAGLPPVLLVEDNETGLKVARFNLEKLGCRVEVARNGLEAVRKCASERFSAVFLDCRMPEMDGYQATAAIRALPAPWNAVPIIAMTADAMESDRRKCLEAGMNDHVPKPIRREDLLEALRRWVAADLRAPEAAGPGHPDEDPDEGDDIRLLFEGEALRQLMEIYRQGAAESLLGMGKAAAAGNAEGLAFLAHDLKGSSLNVGARELARLCADLERQAKGGDLGGTALMVERIRDAIRIGGDP